MKKYRQAVAQWDACTHYERAKMSALFLAIHGYLSQEQADALIAFVRNEEKEAGDYERNKD